MNASSILLSLLGSGASVSGSVSEASTVLEELANVLLVGAIGSETGVATDTVTPAIDLATGLTETGGAIDSPSVTAIYASSLTELSGRNMLKNSRFVGAVAGTPGTRPTNWDGGLWAGTANLSGVSSESVTISATAGRYVLTQTFNLPSNTIWYFYVDVTTPGGLAYESLIFISASTGSNQFYCDGVSVPDQSAILPAGTYRLGIRYRTYATPSPAMTFRLGMGCGGYAVTGSATFAHPTVVYDQDGIYIPSDVAGSTMEDPSAAGLLLPTSETETSAAVETQSNIITLGALQPESVTAGDTQANVVFAGATASDNMSSSDVQANTLITSAASTETGSAVDNESTIMAWGRAVTENAARNFIKNSKFIGAVSGSPGTYPTNWSGFSSGVASLIAGDEEITFTTNNGRMMIFNAANVGNDTTLYFYVDVTTDGQQNHNALVLVNGTAGTSTMYRDGIQVTGSTLCPAGTYRIGIKYVTTNVVPQSVQFRLGNGCAGVAVTSTATFRRPTLSYIQNAEYVPTDYIGSSMIDETAPSMMYIPSIIESAPAVEAIVPSMAGGSSDTFETIPVTDSQVSNFDATASSTETGTAAQTSSGKYSTPAAITETGNAVDVQNAALIYGVLVLENGTVIELTSSTYNTYPSITENGVAADSSLSGKTVGSTLAETGSSSETSSTLRSTPASAVESGSSADASIPKVDFGSSLYEGANASDALSATGVFGLSSLEALALSDAISATYVTWPQITDSGSASDNSSASYATSGGLLEALSAGDGQLSSILADAVIQDVLELLEASTEHLDWGVIALEDMTSSDIQELYVRRNPGHMFFVSNLKDHAEIVGYLKKSLQNQSVQIRVVANTGQHIVRTSHKYVATVVPEEV